MKGYIPLLAIGLVALSTNAFAAQLKSEEVKYNLEAHGARAVVADLAQAGQLPAVVQNIKLGDDVWIALTPKFMEGGNASFSKNVRSALSSALIYNPAAVLSATNGSHALGLADVCAPPDDAREGSAKSSFIQRAEHALSTIRNGDLMKLRDACITALKK